MKSIEIFIDESGSMDRGRPMNISGIVLVGEKGLKDFHKRVYGALKNARQTAGVCDFRREDATPDEFLPKRPANAESWDDHWQRVNGAAASVETIAGENGVEIAAFSLTFPSNTESPWRATDPALAQIIDRPYDARLQDVLELLFFEADLIANAITAEEGCAISLNLPTRTSATSSKSGEHRTNLMGNLRNNWGKKAWRGWDERWELMCNVMEPSDGIEILTSALNRRRHRLPEKVTFERCCCCKLVDWEKWDDWDVGKREKYGKYELAPRQIHYIADFLANAVFNQGRSGAFLQGEPVSRWLERGFVLDADRTAADPWILASRLFANGDRVGAIKELDRHKPGSFGDEAAGFFRQCSGDWPGQLTGGDLRALFTKLTTTSQRISGQQQAVSREPGKTGVKGSGEKTVLDLIGGTPKNKPECPPADQGVRSDPESGGEGEPSEKTAIKCRVLLKVSGKVLIPWFLDNLSRIPDLPVPQKVRAFESESGMEFLLDFANGDEVRLFLEKAAGKPLRVGPTVVEVLDASSSVDSRMSDCRSETENVAD